MLRCWVHHMLLWDDTVHQALRQISMKDLYFFASVCFFTRLDHSRPKEKADYNPHSRCMMGPGVRVQGKTRHDGAIKLRQEVIGLFVWLRFLCVEENKQIPFWEMLLKAIHTICRFQNPHQLSYSPTP